MNHISNAKLKVVLVYLRSFDHYSYWNPLSIESLIGHLEGKLGDSIHIEGIDITEKTQIENINSILQYFDVIGFSVSSYTLDVLKTILAHSDLSQKKVIIGNQLATYLPDALFDFIASNSNLVKSNLFMSLGEGEECLEKLFTEMLQSSENFDSVPNLVYYSDTRGLVHTEKIPLDLSNLDFPPKYLDSENIEKTYQMQLSRGCYWGACAFCTRFSFRHNRRWQPFGMDRIFKDLENIIISKAAKNIEFCDDEFFGGRKAENLSRAYSIARKIKELCDRRGEKINYRVFTRPDFVFRPDDAEGNEAVKNLLSFMKGTGLSRVYLGIESGCDSQLKRYNRGINTEIAMGALKALGDINLKFDSGFILFDPDLKLEEITGNIEFYKQNNLIETNQWFWRPMIANVGSRIGQRLLKKGNEYDLNSMSIKYEYSDKIVQNIYNIVDSESEKTRSIFYALKSISKKDYDYEDQDEYNAVAHEIVKRNGMIYVNLLEEITKAILKEREAVNVLVEDVKRLCAQGTFGEKDADALMQYIQDMVL